MSKELLLDRFLEKNYSSYPDIDTDFVQSTVCVDANGVEVNVDDIISFSWVVKGKLRKIKIMRVERVNPSLQVLRGKYLNKPIVDEKSAMVNYYDLASYKIVKLPEDHFLYTLPQEWVDEILIGKTFKNVDELYNMNYDQ